MKLRGDLGPMDLAALARLAASFFSDIGIRLHYAGEKAGYLRMLLDLLVEIDVTHPWLEATTGEEKNFQWS